VAARRLHPARVLNAETISHRNRVVGDLVLGAVGLMLIIEGAMPLLSPNIWRQVFEQAIRMSDGQIRFLGLTSVLIGLMVLMFWR
jgi:uncharacterized protein